MLRSMTTEASYYGPKAIIGKRTTVSKPEGGEMAGCYPACHLVCHKSQQMVYLVFTSLMGYLTVAEPLTLTFT